MEFEMVSQFIGSLGFPIIVCVYMMTTMNKTIKENSTAVAKLVNIVEKLCEKVDHND